MSLPISRIPHPHDAPPLRWGILAPGGISHTFCAALRKHTRAELVAVGSRSRGRADVFADEFDIARRHGSYEALVADDGVDAIYVASPINLHAEHALLAINAGKHVLVEKAFTQTATQAREVVSAARDAGVTCVEAMWTRFLPHIDVVRQLLRDGALGALEVMTADHGQYFVADPYSRLLDPALAGGAMLDLGVYPVSFASFVMGTPGRVRAVGTRTATGVDRQVSMVFDEFAEHEQAHALLNTTLAARTPTTATISGSMGRIEIPGDFYAPQRVHFTALGEHDVRSPEPMIYGHEGLAFEAAHFAQLVADGRQESPLITLDESVSIVETMETALSQLA